MSNNAIVRTSLDLGVKMRFRGTSHRMCGDWTELQTRNRHSLSQIKTGHCCLCLVVQDDPEEVSRQEFLVSTVGPFPPQK